MWREEEPLLASLTGLGRWVVLRATARRPGHAEGGWTGRCRAVPPLGGPGLGTTRGRVAFATPAGFQKLGAGPRPPGRAPFFSALFTEHPLQLRRAAGPRRAGGPGWHQAAGRRGPARVPACRLSAAAPDTGVHTPKGASRNHPWLFFQMSFKP